MFNIGDLVRRVKILSVTDIDYEWISYEGADKAYGIILDIERAVYETKVINLKYPEIFVKVLWQQNDYGAIWHWGEEISLIKRGK
jgi:hypothetical protein